MIVIDIITPREANHYVEAWHRHCQPVLRAQQMFAMRIAEYHPPTKDWSTLGVLIVGNPCGRPAGSDRKLIKELRRVAFKQNVIFHKIRRHYGDTGAEISRKQVPVIARLSGGTVGTVVPANSLPSTFVDLATQEAKHRLPSLKKIWTYVLEGESGVYLEQAGYELEKKFTRRGKPKRRYGLAC